MAMDGVAQPEDFNAQMMHAVFVGMWSSVKKHSARIMAMFPTINASGIFFNVILELRNHLRHALGFGNQCTCMHLNSFRYASMKDSAKTHPQPAANDEIGNKDCSFNRFFF